MSTFGASLLRLVCRWLFVVIFSCAGIDPLALWAAQPGVQRRAKRPAALVAAKDGKNSGDFADVFLPAPRELKQLVSRARKSLEQQRYTTAVAQLGSLLANPEAEDYFISRDGEPGATISLKAEARRLLGSMPREGRESYELQFGAESRRLLEEAVSDADIGKLTKISRKFFHTHAGYDATFILGRYHLDRGRPLAAALTLKRIAETPATRDQYEPELSITLALSWLYAGMEENAQRTLIELKKIRPAASIPIGDQEVPLFSDDAKAVDWLEHQIGRRRNARTWEEQQWLMFQGNPSRSARTAGGTPLITGDNPLVNCRWRVPIANDKTLEDNLRKIHRQYLGDDLPALPGLHPLAVDDVILLRTPRRLVAIDFRSGKRLWFFGERMFEESERPGTAGQLPESRFDGPTTSGGIHHRMWDDAPFGKISSDGDRVFLLHDLGYPSTQSMSRVIVMPNGRQMINPVWPKTHNQLIALELSSEGKLIWEVGGRSGGDDGSLTGAFFLGPPLPLSGQLYVLAEINGEIRLLVLDPANGKLVWSQQLVHLNDAGTIVTNSVRRVCGATPSFADGVLICPTAAGAVVAIDVATRSLLWGYQYKQTQRLRRHGIWARGHLRVTHGQPGARWADNSITIAGGRVLMTPPESSEMLCLNLVDGKLLWKRERGDSLLLACVEGDTAVVVGKHHLTGVQLADGKDAWQQPAAIPNEAMPSGHGFHSNHHYYLPTTGNEVLKLDLREGQIVERIATGNTLGNLICYKDNVVALSVDFLTAFFQIDPLRRSVQQRLENDSEDAIALAQHGQLLLHEGQRHVALMALRRSQELRPDDATRALLVDTLLRALREDFDSNGQLATEVDELIDQPVQRSEYLRLMTIGLQRVGKLPEAFEACLKLIEMGDPQIKVEDVEPRLIVRRDRWIQGQLAGILGAADTAQRKEMDQVLHEKLAAAVTQGSSMPLRRVIAYFDGHPVAQQARLRLARHLVDADELLEADLILTDLMGSSNAQLAAPATAIMALMLEKAMRYDEAAETYRQLRDHWLDVPCLDDKTGRELFETLNPESRVGQALTSEVHWPRGKVFVQRMRASKNRPRPNYQRSFPLTSLDARGGRTRTRAARQNTAQRTRSRNEHRGRLGLDNVHVSLDARRTIVGRDGHGADRFRASLLQSNSPPHAFPGNVGLTTGRAAGHLLVTSYGFHVFAVDTLLADGKSSDRVLWRQSLTTLGNSAGNNAQIRQKVNANVWGWHLPITVDNTAKSSTQGKPIGSLGPLNANGICFQRGRELLCVDPLRGNSDPIWVRQGLPPGCDLFGDRDHLLVVPPGQTEAMVLRPADGVMLGSCKIPAHRWITTGRLVLTWREEADRLFLMMFDPWYGESVWSHDFAAGSKGWLIGRDEVGVMQPDGRFVLLQLADGVPRVDAMLQTENSLSGIYVLRSRDQYLLVVNTPPPTSQREVTYTATPTGRWSPMIYGRIYAFDRDTGAVRWPVPAEIDQYGLPLDQPPDLPVLLLMRNERRPNGRKQELTNSVVCLDKRDGRILLEQDKMTANTGTYSMVGTPQKNTVTLVLRDSTFTFQFTDNPVPPEPPAQIGHASSLVTSTQRRTIGRVAGAIIGALQESSAPFQIELNVKLEEPAPAADDEAKDADAEDTAEKNP